ncbi:MAG: hypothetical protein NVS4B13_03980 [Candidatus Elarobacter sp.]
MTRGIALAGLLAIAATAAPSRGSAQGAPDRIRPLRTLVYSVLFSSKIVNEEHRSGLTATGASPYGSPTAKRTSSVDDSGTLTANVIAASRDGGLAVDVSFVGKATTQPPVRVAILPDGRLSYPPTAQLSPEAARIVSLLARGIMVGRDVSPGSSWTITAAAPAKGTSTYRVTTVAGDLATLGIDIDVSQPGPSGFDEQATATALYDTVKLCPVRYDLTATARREPSMAQYVIENTHLTATLVSDTFAKK